MRSTVESLMAIKHGFDLHFEELEDMRIERIRKSDIAREYMAFDEALRSAKYLRHKKPPTGLIRFRELLTKMGR